MIQIEISKLTFHSWVTSGCPPGTLSSCIAVGAQTSLGVLISDASSLDFTRINIKLVHLASRHISHLKFAKGNDKCCRVNLCLINCSNTIEKDNGMFEGANKHFKIFL